MNITLPNWEFFHICKTSIHRSFLWISQMIIKYDQYKTNQIIFFQFSGSVLDNGNSYTSGRHASLLSAPSSSRSMQESTQLREGLLTGTLTGQKVNYLDSGYSEEDPTEQQVTSCLMKTSSGSIYIPPHNMPKNPTMDSRQEYRFGHSSSSPSHSPTKESLKNSERYVYILCNSLYRLIIKRSS